MNQIEELIHRRRRQILIHSYMYYQMNKNLISDHTYDAWCKELAELQRDYPEDSKKVSFYLTDFENFTGETGYHLPKEAWMHDVCLRLLDYHREISKI